MKLGSLFSGAGGLDIAVEQFFGARTVWHCELNPAASKVLAHRWPGVPNLGDITAVDWSEVEPVDILAGGFPCQDVSAAGRRAGIAEGTRSGLWALFAEVINQLRPGVVVIENVRGLLSARAYRAMESEEAAVGDGADGPILRALGAVLGDLADLGYDAQWTTVAASAVGAPHKRERVFIVAHPAGQPWRVDDGDQLRAGWGAQRPGPATGTGSDAHTARDGRHEGRPEPARIIGGPDAAERGDGPVDLLPTPVARDFKGTGPADMNRNSPCMSAIADLLPTPSAADGNGGHMSRSGDRGDELLLGGIAKAYDSGGLLPTPNAADGDGNSGTRSREALERGDHQVNLTDLPRLLPMCDYALLDGTSRWGKYAAAIARWEAVAGPAPSPTEPNKNGNPRLAAAFPEWMMGWPAGWVTEVPGISRNDALRICGNGVCPQQAYAALQILVRVSAYGVVE
ncbi:DNA methyltransferase [Mycobacterium phage Shauna1]|uniref:DNA (cytosine-5-)-methyltransferase n=1 Tax=Mycobacterium phage Shauna1 TaxID=1036615 RepID=G1DU48_9CAUD|nr:DNA methyltransferase [Mycobacterium phage Shauna1]AEJ93041.1 DNA methylase [Mycobacterium phage Shauna1]